MIEIIEKGKKEFIGKCKICDCKFRYELSDLYAHQLRCPECNSIYKHENINTSSELTLHLVEEVERLAYNLRPIESDYENCFECDKKVLDERKKTAQELNQLAIKYLKLVQDISIKNN